MTGGAYGRDSSPARTRIVIFVLAAALHAAALLFFAVRVDTAPPPREELPAVMKIVDLEEALPPPPPPEPPREIPQNAVESIAENFIETEEEPDQTVLPPGSLAGFTAAAAGEGDGEYLPMSMISVLPVFDEREIRARLHYPAIARRANIEGMVYLELLVDRTGLVRQIRILREDPADRGFGEAAAKAFEGVRGKPAEANGTAVGVRYRYPVRFRLTG